MTDTATDERETLLAKLRADHGSPPDASPREITAAQLQRKNLARAYLTRQGSAHGIAAMRLLAQELNIDPDPPGGTGANFDHIYDAALAANHRVTRIKHDAERNFIVPEV